MFVLIRKASILLLNLGKTKILKKTNRGGIRRVRDQIIISQLSKNHIESFSIQNLNIPGRSDSMY